jgi:prophage antirepressor-like protein
MQKADSRVEDWNGHPIRFVERDREWWAVAKDVAEALGYERPKDAYQRTLQGGGKTPPPCQGWETAGFGNTRERHLPAYFPQPPARGGSLSGLDI